MCGLRTWTGLLNSPLSTRNFPESMFDRLDDTIVAISSAAGVSPRGIVRLSGPQARELAASVFDTHTPPTVLDTPSWRRLTGRVRIADDARLPAEAYVFLAPISYTRQDLVELHVPGSPPVLAMVMEELTRAGARPAEPGEFTARAFFAGTLDLTEVEGVAAIIAARNDSQLRASEALLHGELSRRTTHHRDELADLLALIEARIDFAEEPYAFISPEAVVETLEKTLKSLENLCRNAPAVERLEVLPTVLLAGRPNAGKSTLFNRLTGMDRAIQSATAGTTRDLISAPLTLPGGEILLIDSPGLPRIDDPALPSDAGHPDQLAQAATRQAIKQADAVLLVIDAREPNHPADAAFIQQLTGRCVCILGNKADLLDAAQVAPWAANVHADWPTLAVSAVTGQGIDTLLATLDSLVFTGSKPHGGSLLALSNRQREALREACDALQAALDLSCQPGAEHEPTELIAMEIRSAMDALSHLTGQVMTDDLLARIFARFCVGK